MNVKISTFCSNNPDYKNGLNINTNDPDSENGLNINTNNPD